MASRSGEALGNNSSPTKKLAEFVSSSENAPETAQFVKHSGKKSLKYLSFSHNDE
ncbi:hypothetical protein NDI33_23235 [Trichocoleus sp. DQ-A1]